MKKILLLLLPFFISEVTNASLIQRTIISADVVASACHIKVDADGNGNNRLVFNTYRKSTATPVPSVEFTIQMYETGASIRGCSAFTVGHIATIDFGNPGQLDSSGVVTRGAGDGVRIDVRAVDAEADYKDLLTQEKHIVNYPVVFSSKGTFRFRAQPIFPSDVKSGEYSGSLTFSILYQ